MRIVLCYPVEPRHIAQIQAVAPDAEIIDAGQEGVDRELPEADIFCGHAKVPVDWQAVVRRGRLEWVQSSAAGLDHCLLPCVVESGIIVTSASGVLADQVAEQTMALLFGTLRSLPTFFRAQQRKEFIRRPTRDLHDSTVGIVGFGGNGRRIAEAIAPFRTRIIATDLYPFDKPAHVESLWPADRLDDLLQEVDVLILAVPLTNKTFHLIDRRELALMRRGSILVNIARGAVVAEEALVEALQSGHLHGAGLDVTEVEPLPETSKLWDLPNVIITPHVGGQFARRIDQMTDFFCENLRRYLTGKPLNNLVDKRLGFPVRCSA
jgi:phosphoglycerate dehydrogenase-like enzyme